LRDSLDDIVIGSSGTDDIHDLVDVGTIAEPHSSEKLLEEAAVILELFLGVLSGDLPALVGFFIVDTLAGMGRTFIAGSAVGTLK
jgi:hypothetical protein